MSTKHRTVLQRMDALVWWTNSSDRVRQDMSEQPNEQKHGPMRWLPLLPMALGAGLIYSAIAFPVPLMSYGAAGGILAAASSIAINGPLGKSSIDDDEREAALRKNAFLFCLAFLAVANVVAGPGLLVAAALNEWPVKHVLSVAFALFIGNMMWFISLPTLYASWKLPKLSDDET